MTKDEIIKISPGEHHLSAIALILLAALLTGAIKWYASIAALKAVALFFGLEGTVLLASALSPAGDMEERPKGLRKKLVWSFTEGRRLNYPINYNPVLFYCGLLFLAVSFVLSSIA